VAPDDEPDVDPVEVDPDVDPVDVAPDDVPDELPVVVPVVAVPVVVVPVVVVPVVVLPPLEGDGVGEVVPLPPPLGDVGVGVGVFAGHVQPASFPVTFPPTSTHTLAMAQLSLPGM
jgi:hypothetical protein